MSRNVFSPNCLFTCIIQNGLFKAFCNKSSVPVAKKANRELGLNKTPTIWKVSLWSTGDNPTRTECLENGHIRIGWDDYGAEITDDTDFSEQGGKKVLNAFISRMKIGDIVFSCYSSTTIDAIGVVTGDYEWCGEQYEDGLNRRRKVNWIVKGINEVLTADTDCFIALETMAGKGTEIGRSFEELAMIYDGVKYNDKLRVCFDTCHTHDAGYDIVNDFDGVIDKFDRIIGKDQIAAFHINDSKNVFGAGKDRHANLGEGEIGFEAIKNIVWHPDFMHVPKILETPWIPANDGSKNSFPPYKEEIARLRSI